MPLPRKLLNEDEELLAEMRPHWLFFIGPLAAAALTWVAILALLIGVKPPSWTSYPLLALAAVPTVWLAGRLIRWRSYTLALTSTRILVRQGVFGRDTVQLRLQRITEINLAQTFIERMLQTGRLVIDVQGEDDSLILEFVQKPTVVQRVVNSQINELVGGGEREPIPESMRPHEQRHHGGQDDTAPGAGPQSSTVPTNPTLSPTTTPGQWSPQRDDTPPFGTEVVAGEVEPADPDPPPPAAAAAEGSVHEKLIELDDLRRRGILTEEEFQAKKAQLLDRI